MYALVTICQLEWSEIYLYVIGLKCKYMPKSKHIHFKDDSITCSSEKINQLVTIDRSVEALVILHKLGY